MAKRRQEPWEERMDAFEARMTAIWEASQKESAAADKAHRERMASIDRRLDSTSKLLRYGARLLVQVQESQKQLIENLVHPRNGKAKKG